MIIKASASITLTRVDDGDDGKGIKSIVNKYLASSSGSNVTTATSGWTDSIQTITTGKRYLWNYEVITYTDNSTTTTTPVIIGVYGNTGSTGATGNGISSITEYYLVSPNKSGVTTSTSGWSTTIPTMTATNKYLWNYEVIKYTNSTTSTGTPKVIGIYGDKGDKGETGVGISTVDVEYYLSTSSTAQSGGSWSTTAPTWVDGKYMWSRTKTVTTAGKTTYSNPVCITGGKGSTGATGATGKGVSSITEEYYLSTSKTTQTGGSWVTTPPTWSSGKYMWTRSKIVYTNPASTVYTAPVCDSSWEAVNEIDIGGRNLALKTSSSYSTAFSSFSGVTNTCPGVGTVLTDGLKAGDTITIRMIYKYTDIVAATGQTAQCWIQGSGDVTEWSGGRFDSSPHLTISGSGEYEFLYNIKITANHVKNSKWSVNIRHDYVQSGSIQFKMFKVEKGNKATDWSPAPEDVDNRLTSAEQKITPEAILNSVNTQISAGGAINTVSTILDKTGFTVKNGALKVQNNAGLTVLSGDTNGNLWIQNNVTVGGNTNGSLLINNSSGSTVFSANKNGLFLKDGIMKVTTGAITTSGIGSYPTGETRDMTVYAYGLDIKEVDTNGSSQIYVKKAKYQGGHSEQIIDNTGNSTQTSWRNYNSGRYILLQRATSGLTWNDTIKMDGEAGSIVANGTMTTGNNVYINNGHLYLNESGTEQQLRFVGCSTDNRLCYFYKGKSSSATRVGLYDYSGGYAVWRYTNSNNFVVDRPLYAQSGINVTGAVVATAESKFSVGTYSDPWHGTGCAIKATGNIAATGTIRANGIFKLGSTTYGALGYDSSSTDVYVENAANNWLRLKKDMSMTYAGYQVYTAKNFGTIPIVGTRITNLNTRLASGWYSWSSGATGAPASYGVLLVIQWSAGADFCQIAISTGNSMWTRWYVNGSYTGWVAK